MVPRVDEAPTLQHSARTASRWEVTHAVACCWPTQEHACLLLSMRWHWVKLVWAAQLDAVHGLFAQAHVL